MAIKWGNTTVTAVKWGNTTCTVVKWGNTKVFPDEITLFNGGDVSSKFIGMNYIHADYTRDSYVDYWWSAKSGPEFTTSNFSFNTTNPRKASGTIYAEFSLTNGLYYYSRHAYKGGSEENQLLAGYTKFVYNANKINFSGKTTIVVTVNTSYAKVPIYVGGLSSTAAGSSVQFVWCIRSDTTTTGTSTLTYTIPSANRNADCYFGCVGTLATELGQDNEFSHTITKITYY